MKVPPKHNGVFEVKVHGETEGTYIIAPYSQLEEKNSNIFQHEIAIISDDEGEPFPLIAVTNLGPGKNTAYWKRRNSGICRTRDKLCDLCSNDK